MSGVAGGNRIQKKDVDRTFQDYQDKVLQKIPGFKGVSLSGSVKAKSKPDFGDLDLIVYFEGEDKKKVKQDIINVVSKMPDNLIVPFKSEKYTGRKYYNSGEIITILFPISGTDETIQVDNIIALSQIEQEYKTSFLDLPAEKQGLILGLSRVILQEENPQEVFKRLGIKNVPPLEKNQEYEFNLSSSKLSLRIVTLDNFKEVARKVVWESTDWSMVEKLLANYDLNKSFEELFNQIKQNLKKERSFRRLVGIFKSMISIKSGEIGTPKGANKEKAIKKVQTLVSEKIIKEDKNKTLGIALVPGAFKPPTKGHFEAVRQLATNNYKEADWKTLPDGTMEPGTLSGKKPITEIKEVRVIISGKARNGVSAEQSKEIWDVYNKYLPNNVEIFITKDPTPVKTAYDMVIENPDEMFFLVSALRDESDMTDLKRLTSISKYNNARPLILKSDNEDISATELRKAVITNSYEAFKDMIPDQLTDQEAQMVFNTVKQTVQAEQKMYDAMGDFFDNLFEQEEKEVVKEGNSGTPISARGTVSAADRQRLVVAYNRLVDVLGAKFYDIKFNQDHIRVQLPNEDEKIGFDYTPYMGSILEYMIDEGMKITPLPEIKLKSDPVESADFFGKTAYYDPNLKEITLYVEGRHPKDVMRSFVHEMIHHIQNIEGRINNIGTTNVNEDEALVELEKEAYMLGNMTFRSWTDKVTNG
jgi:hypothetical protein